MTAGRLLWIFQRFLSEGPRLSWWKYRRVTDIRCWKNPFSSLPKQSVPIHVVGGHEHQWMAAWMLASFFFHTKRHWPVVWHDDGTGDAAIFSWLASTFDAQIIPRTEADLSMIPRLANHPKCLTYRERTPLALKCFDVPFFTQSPRFLLLDPDVLFFRPPKEILDWVDSDDGKSVYFNADFQEPSLIAPETVRSDLGFSLWPRVNSGLCLLRRDLLDEESSENWLAHSDMENGHFWRKEQTLWALAASRRKSGGLLSSTYEVTAQKSVSQNAVARHYVGLVRARFYTEGIRKLHVALLP